MNYAADFHDKAAIRGRFNAYGREEDLEPGNIMRWEVNNLTPRVSLGIILVGISEIQNSSSEVVGGCYSNHQMECR